MDIKKIMKGRNVNKKIKVIKKIWLILNLNYKVVRYYFEILS